MMYRNIKYIHITQSYSKTRKKMCVKPALSVNLTDTVGKGLINCPWSVTWNTDFRLILLYVWVYSNSIYGIIFIFRVLIYSVGKITSREYLYSAVKTKEFLYHIYWWIFRKSIKFILLRLRFCTPTECEESIHTLLHTLLGDIVWSLFAFHRWDSNQ